MAAVSNAVVGIDDDQRFALMKFRRSVKDVMKPEHDDHLLLRFLKARQWDPEAAEKMLRDSLVWREKWGVDTSLASWQAPEVLETYFPSGSTGFDKEGSPVIIVPLEGLDVYGLLHSVTRTDIIRMVLRHLEGYLTLGRKQAQAYGPAAMKVCVIFDLEGFNMRQYMWRPAAEMVVTLLQIYEANYPEILKCCFIVNAPKVFSLAFNIIKKFMHENTISKIRIYSADTKKWQPPIQKIVEKDQLPVCYGGSLTDANGDGRCRSIVKPGGKVPKRYYIKNITSEKEYTKVTIKAGDKHNVELICLDPDNVLRWEIGTDSHEIKFLIRSKDEDGHEKVVFDAKKVHAGETDTGVINAPGPATYTVTFDNSNAYFRNKKIYYDLVIANPGKDLNTSDIPEEEIRVNDNIAAM